MVFLSFSSIYPFGNWMMNCDLMIVLVAMFNVDIMG